MVRSRPIVKLQSLKRPLLATGEKIHSPRLSPFFSSSFSSSSSYSPHSCFLRLRVNKHSLIPRVRVCIPILRVPCQLGDCVRERVRGRKREGWEKRRGRMREKEGGRRGRGSTVPVWVPMNGTRSTKNKARKKEHRRGEAGRRVPS